jgi:hypothetical protein
MKKTIIKAGLFSCITMALVLSCNSPAEELEIAQNNLKQAGTELIKANEEYLEDIAQYRKETADKIAANGKSIADFKLRIANEKKSAKADYTKKIAELEQKNTDSKKKMDDYKAEGLASWKKFKSEFGHDMDALGKAFKDFGINNVK